MKIVLAFLLGWAVCSPAFAQAQTVSVTSSTAGVRVTTDLGKRTRVVLDPASTVPVWILEVYTTALAGSTDPCPAQLTNTTRTGVRLSRASADKDPIGWEYGAFQGSYSSPPGSLCAILESGATPQTLYISTY